MKPSHGTNIEKFALFVNCEERVNKSYGLLGSCEIFAGL